MMIDVRRALVLSFGERYALMAFALLGSVFIARLLTPQEIGIYSVSLALIGIAQVVRDFGVGSFLIQEKHLDKEHIRTAFTFMIMIGSALFVLTFLSAPFVARYYAESRLADTIRISAINFLVLPFCSISLSLLRRDMAFDRLIVVNLSAALVGFCVILTLAYRGFGPNSMAIGAVASNVVTGAGAWLARTDRIVLMPGLTHWRSILRFGTQTSVASIVTTISMDINDLAVGKLLGFAPVAMLSRAQGLMHLFNRDLMGAIRNVAFPSFAESDRNGEALEPKYIAAVSTVTAAAWPFYGFTAIFSLEIVRLLYGPQWDEAARLVPLYCAAGAVAATCNLILNVVMATGRVDLVTRAELIFQPIRALLIVGAALIFKSLAACAIAFLLAFLIHAPFLYWIKSRCLPNDTAQLSRRLFISAKVSLSVLLIPLATAASFGLTRSEPIPLPLFLVLAALFPALWIGALIAFRHPVIDDPAFKRLATRFTQVQKEAE